MPTCRCQQGALNFGPVLTPLTQKFWPAPLGGGSRLHPLASPGVEPAPRRGGAGLPTSAPHLGSRLPRRAGGRTEAAATSSCSQPSAFVLNFHCLDRFQEESFDRAVQLFTSPIFAWIIMAW